LQLQLLEQRLNLQSDAPHVREGNARTWIQIDPKLIRMFEVTRTHGMRVELEAA
jgi:hypothetical protein